MATPAGVNELEKVMLLDRVFALQIPADAYLCD